MADRLRYDWKRFWHVRGTSPNLHDGGYLVDPDSPYGRYWNDNLHSFEAIATLPCLALLGEPGIGKTSTMQVERDAIDEVVTAEGGVPLWLDLRSCGSEDRLVNKLFRSREFASWLEGDHRLHIFLDSLDECLLRVDTVAALLVDELQDCPVERLYLRVGCRTADWPGLLEDGMKEMWKEEGFGAYELAPLRRVDVAGAATANGIDPEVFLQAVREAEAEPLAIKPVTMDFLLHSYAGASNFPNRQADLYLDGCRWLCEERNDSRRVTPRRTGELTPDQRLVVAARIAAVTIFSNKYAIWNGVQQSAPEKEDVLVRTLAGGTETVGEDEFVVGEDAIREVLGTGLFSARGLEKLGWAHQTYAEFLAAHYLVQREVSVEKVMSFIIHPDDDEGRLVPQLHEVAAWLASMSPEVFRTLTEVVPEVLLRSDVASTEAEGKTALVGTLLGLYDEERLLEIEWAPRDRYKKLEHPGLAEQLRPYIVDGSKGLSARRVALDIAEACELRSLQKDAAEVALDANQDLLIRKEAARFVADVGDAPTRIRLMPLALGTAGDDPEDDLKGNGLRAVWPDHVGAEELFEMLTSPKNPNYMGAYESFLAYELTARLSTADLPAALAWVEGRDADHEEFSRFGELADTIMQRAWAELPNPGIAPAFGRAALARLRRHEEVVKERREVFSAVDEPTFSERVAADDHRRLLLLEDLISLLEQEEDDAYLLVHWKTPLVTGEDVGWLLKKMRAEVSNQRKTLVAALVGRTPHLWDDTTHELVYLAHLEDPVLAHEVSRYFAPVEFGSEEEKTQRRHHEMSSRWKEKDDEPSPPDPPVAARVASALDNFESGDVEAFWTGVYHFMQCDERGFGSVSGAEWDMTELPGWKAADDGTRVRIVEAAKRYVLEGDPRTDEWFGKDVIYRPAFAGYRALCLLLRFVPEFLQGLPRHAWEKWIPIILDFSVTLNTEEEKGPHLRLVATAYNRAPDCLISTLLALMDHEDAKGHVFVTRRLERCWDNRLARAVLEKAKDPALKSSTLGILLDELLGYGLREAREFVESLVSSGDEGDEEHRRRAVVAARALFFGAEDSGWGVLWPAMRDDDWFGSAVVDEIASGVRHSELPYEHLTECQVADFYVWMARRYPHSEYFLDYRNGMITYGRKEHISEWRDGIMRHLQGRGTFEACRQIERVAAELPELRERLKGTLYQARAEARRRTWVAPEPRHVLDLAARRAARLVQNGDQLLEVLIESLKRFQGRLQGETPAVFALWNEVGGSYTPKDEERLSDEVKLHLEQDLAGRGVVVNREVVISRGAGSLQGERTDIHVDADVRSSERGQYETISVIIEVKGCWNRALNTAMERQLVNRYLRRNRCRHGLYLVGWFNCDQWDDTDSRRGRAPKHGIEVARAKLEEQASRLSQGDLRVRSVVLDTALR